ncbi:MAG: winged helix-turn-helix transcriptional regulator [Phycisphaerales bacterium]|nr:winged helix-turn-helix transcriptional regulator [Phycisphaerales bacterium]
MPRGAPSSSTADLTTGQRVVAGLSKVALVFRHAQWEASGRRGLTPTQSQILAIVAGSRVPDRLGVKAVAEQMAVTMGTASEAVGALVSKGLLRKEADEADGRAVILRLTPRGVREASVASEWSEVIVDAVEAMPEAERATLLRGLIGMVRTMEGRGLVPTARMCVGCRFFSPNEHPGRSKPHHCLFIEAPIGDADLRIDCGEMEPAGEQERSRLWDVFVNGRPLDRQCPGDAGRAHPGAGVSKSRQTVSSSTKGA